MLGNTTHSNSLTYYHHHLHSILYLFLLSSQDDADKQWLEDVEARNQQQIVTLRAFEDKCKRLYDVRLTEYAEKSGQQIAQYEEQLLEVNKGVVCVSCRWWCVYYYVFHCRCFLLLYFFIRKNL